MNKIYVTHCSRSKNDILKGKDVKVIPKYLYTSPRIKSFIKKCEEQRVRYAILSDKHGIVFQDEMISWYEKSPDEVRPSEVEELKTSFDTTLQYFDMIFFYVNPMRFHNVYRRIINESKLKDKIKLISKVEQINSQKQKNLSEV